MLKDETAISSSAQPWMDKPLTDTLFILLPPFLSLLFIVLFPALFQDNQQMPDAWWVILVLLVDVAHVYSTLYRTYFDKKARTVQKPLLIAIPLISLVAGILVYSIGPMLFWRILAYLAVFHFVRQQYGFMRLYSRRETHPVWMMLVDKITIYYATIYPIIFWHLSAPRNFHWFLPGDFMYASSSLLLTVCTAVYVAVLLLYIIKEALVLYQTRSLNIPKFAVISGTILSWYFGIVYFNGDMAFTLLNVVSHGIPYMALVWIYTNKQTAANDIQPEIKNKSRGWSGLLTFLVVIFLLAYIEEGFWDLFLWKEHSTVFGSFHIETGEYLLNFIVPLLAVPQITHYIIDGYIWRIKKQIA